MILMSSSKDMKSKVFQARKNSQSLRGTIPTGIVSALKIKHGDVLTWDVEVKEGKIVAIVKKEN